MLIRDIDDYHFRADTQIGLTMRWGKSYQDNPLWAPVPELADISISNHCSKGCSFCYRESKINNEFMSVEDYCFVLDSIKHPKYGTVFQVALGGGEPLEHPEFLEIIDATRDRGIVPNFTTNGIYLTPSICKRLQGKIGAIALSISEIKELDLAKIEMLKQYGLRVNVHYILSGSSIKEAIDIIQGRYDQVLSDVNAFIFLTYKPAGRAKRDFVLRKGVMLDTFVQGIQKRPHSGLKYGFDACFVPMLLKGGFDKLELVDVCEAGFFSVYIDHKMNVSPCSFSGNKDQYNLKEYTFYDIWENKFLSYRESQKNLCGNIACAFYKICRGRCAYFPEITACYENND